jgi:hypothetical protein
MMKKIITSAAVAAALTTGAFAAAAALTSGATTSDSYNKLLVAAMDSASVDVNTSNVAYVGSGFNANYKITLSVTGGAKFDATKGIDIWTDDNKSDAVINTDFSDDNTSVTYTVSNTPIAAGTRLTFAYNEANGTLPLILPKGTTGDISLKLTALDHNDKDMPNAKAQLAAALVTAKENKATGTLACNTTNKVAIDTVDRKEFLSVSTKVKEFTCKLTTDHGDISADIDFNYTDVNATIAFSGGDFNNGKFVTSGGATASTDGKTLTIASPIADNNATTFKYVLNTDSSTLAPATFAAKVDYGYKASPDATVTKNSVNAVDAENALEWTLDVYVAKIINVAHAVATSTKSMLKVYNNSNEDTTVKLKVYNVDGTEQDIALTDNTLKANSSRLIMTGRELPDTLVNGYVAEVSLDVEATEGDVVAYQNSSIGKVELKVIDENNKNNGN